MHKQVETWERIAKDVGPGWNVVRFDASTGETTGTVAAGAELVAGVLRVPVRWQIGTMEYDEIVEASAAQRVARYIDSNVLMSGVASTLLFCPRDKHARDAV